MISMTIKQLVERKTKLREALDIATTSSATEEGVISIDAKALETLSQAASEVLDLLEDMYENTEITKDISVC